MSTEREELIRPERTSNPEFSDWGAWYVDDQVQVVFFDTEAEAQQYADYCIASDLDRAQKDENHASDRDASETRGDV